jgi:hypothetical protein
MLGSDRFGQWAPDELKLQARQHPLLMTGGTTLGLLGLRKLLKNRALAVKTSSVHLGDDAISMAPVDAGSIIEKLATAWAPIIYTATDCG